ncbi:Transposase [Pseudomonas yamanorum]
MYSYEGRIRAVELYIKVGKRAGLAIRQLGYPTKNSLKSWPAEYERCLDLPRGYENSKSKYSLAQKGKAVEYSLKHGRSIAATVTALGYPTRDSLRAWIYELLPELYTRVIGRSDGLARLPAMKQAAVIALCTRKESAKALAEKLGVCRPTLYNRKNQLLGPEVSVSMKRRLKRPSSPSENSWNGDSSLSSSTGAVCSLNTTC